jgi:glycosyltransferase involved in cell wall biosynthesis
MNKKVLFVTTIIRTVEAFLLPHIMYFKNKGFEVGVAANTDNSDLNKIEELGVTIHHVPFSRSVFNKGNLISYQIIKKIMRDYHILHLHTPISSFITRMASSKGHTVIYCAHGFHFNENGSRAANTFYKLVERLAGARTNKLIVTNKDDIAAARTIIAPEKIDYVNGVGLDQHIYDIDRYTEQNKLNSKFELGLDHNKKIITHIAEFNQNKRQIDIVRACEILKDKTQNFTILLVGTGEDAEAVQNQIQESHLEQHIQCLGFRKDISNILSITDIGLLVSIREGLPRSLMEMMAMKIPIIATDIRGNRDLIENGENGYLIPIKDPQLLADKCLHLLTNDHQSEKFGKAGREKIENYFSLEKVLHQMEKVYIELGILDDNH